MTRDQIIAIVRAKMDEINPLDQGNTIKDPQIDAQLDFATINLMETLPSILAYPVEETVDAENLIEDLSIDVVCPSDFLRLHKLKLFSWNRSIYSLLPADHPRIDLQIYKHLKATVNRPVGVISRSADGDIITCYPPPDDTLYVVEEFLYVRRPENAQSLNEQLIDLLAWNAACIVYSIHGEGNFSKLCLDRLAQMIEAKLKYRP